MILEGCGPIAASAAAKNAGFFADKPKQPEPRETPPRAPRRGYN